MRIVTEKRLHEDEAFFAFGATIPLTRLFSTRHFSSITGPIMNVDKYFLEKPPGFAAKNAKNIFIVEERYKV